MKCVTLMMDSLVMEQRDRIADRKIINTNHNTEIPIIENRHRTEK